MISIHDQTAHAVVSACISHMRQGGTHIAGQLLADQLQNECNAQAIAEARQKEIADAVAAQVKQASDLIADPNITG
jgi:hypothetical protein